MSRTNLSCHSCMCCDEEEDVQPTCCDSIKCELNRRKLCPASRDTQTKNGSFSSIGRCCPQPESDPSYPMCRATVAEKKKSCIEPPEPKPGCPKCTPKEPEPSCPRCGSLIKEPEPGCPMCTPREPEPTCPRCGSSMKQPEPGCPMCTPREPEPGCPKCSLMMEKSSCIECHKPPEPEHSCPRCKSMTIKLPKEVKSCQPKKPEGCPICAAQKEQQQNSQCSSQPQTITIPCCDSQSPHSISVMLVPEKLLKDLAGNRSKCDDENDPNKKRDVCCKRDDSKKPVPLPPYCGADSCKPGKKESVPCCPLEPCKSNAKASASKVAVPEKNESKNLTNESKTKNDKNKVMCSEECAAMKDNPCKCVFPPAYKQYNCVGQISGECNCTKEEEQKTE